VFGLSSIFITKVVPKYRSLFLSTCFGTIFSWQHQYLLQVSRTVTSVASEHMFSCHCEAYSFAFPLQDVDLDKHISPRHSELSPPPFLVKWNPGLDGHICGRLQSSVEKWSQKIFLWALCRLTGALFRLQVSVRVNPYNYWWKITTVTSVIFSLTWALFRLTGEPLQLLEANRCLFSGIWPDMRAI